MADSGASEQGTARSNFDVKGIAQLALIVAVIAVAVYFARAPASLSGVDAPAAVSISKPTVGVVRPAATRAAREVRTTGTVAALGTVAITSQVAGAVVYVAPVLRNGSAFAAGQPLLRIDAEDYEIRLAAGQAALRQRQAQLAKKRLRGEARSAKFRRENPGVEVPPLVAGEPQIAKAQAKVDRARQAVKKAEVDLRRTTISLPFDGWIANTDLQVGQVVGPAAPLGQAFAKDALRVEVRVSQEDLASLAPVVGRAAKVRAGAATFDAVVRRVSAIVDLRSRQATLFLALDENSDGAAQLPRPGTFVQVSLEGPPLDGVFVLPEAAEQAGGSVWVVDGDALQSVMPRSLGRNRGGWLVEAFDARGGVVLGRVPNAYPGLPVDVASAP